MKQKRMRPQLTAESVMALIEIPRGSKNKYEWNDEMECVMLSRVLFQSVAYPTEYGFIPGTLAPDGDALDILVLIDQPTFPGCCMRVRPIGVLRMTQQGKRDDKILSVAITDPLYAQTRDIADIPPHRLVEVRHFFATYTELEGRNVEVEEWGNAAAAMAAITECLLPDNEAEE
jgi:inorganic pyrophosphatase